MKLYNYLESIPRSSRKVFIAMVLSIALVPTLVNLLFVSDSLRALLDNRIYFVGLSLVVFASWLLLGYLLLKRDTVQLRHLSLTKEQIIIGVAVGSALFVVVNIALAAKAAVMGEGVEVTDKFSSLTEGTKVIGLFVFHFLISAFVEEVFCRAYILPQAYNVLSRRLKYKSVALLLALLSTQFLFALSHLPSQLLRFNIDTAAVILSTQGQLFLSGLILAIVYLRTKNIIFVTMLHAMMNYGLAVVGTDADFKLFYMVAAFAVTIFWTKLVNQDKQLAPVLPAGKVA